MTSLESKELRHRSSSSFGSITSIPTLPTGKLEYTDGTNWYPLATEAFVQNNMVGQLQPCLVATVSNLAGTYINNTAGVGATLSSSTTSGIFVLDGVTPPLNARILVKDQMPANNFQNGIYTLTIQGSTLPSVPWVLTRSTDFDSAVQIMQGAVINVATGATNSVTSWMQTALVTSIGTSAITFAPVSLRLIPGSDAGAMDGGAKLPGGTTAQRPSPVGLAGTVRFNNGS